MRNERTGREWTVDSALAVIRRNTRNKIKFNVTTRFTKILVLHNTAGLTSLGAIDYLDKLPGFMCLIVKELPK